MWATTLCSLMLLYENWLKILDLHASEVAIRVPVRGEEWTFAALQEAVLKESPLSPGTLHIVRSTDGVVPFVIQTLRAWRDQAVLCPVEADPPVFLTEQTLPAGIVHLKLTSGTTGSARAVMFKAEQLAADPEHIRKSMRLEASAPNIAVISVAHSYGFSNLILPMLLQGHPLIVAADVLPSSLKKAWEGQKAVTVPGVPAMWRAWFRAGLLKDAPIQLAISAGAPLPIDLEQQIYEQTGLKIHNFLGSSECGAIAYDASDTPRTDPSSVGTMVEGLKLSLNEQGCLVVEGPSIAEGYLENPANSDSSPASSPLANRRFTTSDLADIRGNEIYLRGRASDTINLAGRKLDPTEVEAALLKHQDIVHCVVFGVPSRDTSRCEETVACIKTNRALTVTELSHWLANELSSWKRPRHYWFCDELAPNERGKIPRPKWREIWIKKHKIDN